MSTPKKPTSLLSYFKVLQPKDITVLTKGIYNHRKLHLYFDNDENLIFISFLTK